MFIEIVCLGCVFLFKVVAVKQLDRNGLQGNKDFLGEVNELSLLSHPNLVKFNGYCADGDQRILVYEYMPGGSLGDRLFGMYSEYYKFNSLNLGTCYIIEISCGLIIRYMLMD